MNIFSALKTKLTALRTDLTAALAALKISGDEKSDEKSLLASLVTFATGAQTELTALRAQLGAALTKAGVNLVDTMKLSDMVTALAAKVSLPAPAAESDESRRSLAEAEAKIEALETELGETQASIEERATALALEQMATAGFKPLKVAGTSTAPGQDGKTAYQSFSALTGAAQSKYFRDHKADILASWPKPV